MNTCYEKHIGGSRNVTSTTQINAVLASFVLDVSKAFDQAIKMVQDGNFSGQIFKPGLEAGKKCFRRRYCVYHHFIT